jgi:hypothetical protein
LLPREEREGGIEEGGGMRCAKEETRETGNEKDIPSIVRPYFLTLWKEYGG